MGQQVRTTMSGRITDQEAFTALAKRMVQDVEAHEPGTLDYEWFAGPDGTFFIHELYRDSKAFTEHVKIHMENGDIDEMMACCDVQQTLVLTKPDAASKKLGDQFGATYLRGIGGVVR